MFPALYVSEPGFQFDTVRGNKITKRNLNYKIADFSEILKAYRRYYRTSNIMMPMGDDFSFQVAEWSFENIDKLIE
jgi:lysosomal alpha-mannosidase